MNTQKSNTRLFFSLIALSFGATTCPVHAMQAPRTFFKLARTGLFATASYFIYDTVRNDGKKTRSAVEKSTNTLKELFNEGTTQVKILIGATHDETVALLKKQHEEAVRRLRTIERQNRQLLAQNNDLKEQVTTLVTGQQRIEQTLNPAAEQPNTLLHQIQTSIRPEFLPTEIKQK